MSGAFYCSCAHANGSPKQLDMAVECIRCRNKVHRAERMANFTATSQTLSVNDRIHLGLRHEFVLGFLSTFCFNYPWLNSLYCVPSVLMSFASTFFVDSTLEPILNGVNS